MLDGMSAQRTGSKGTWIVMAMIGLGLLGGLISTWYWSTKVQVIDDPAEGAGSVPFDRQRAEAELRETQDHYATLRESGGIDAALAELTRLVEKYPRYAAARSQLALVLSDSGRLEEAYAQLERCLDLDGQQPNVHMLAGTIATNLNDLAGAAHHYSQAIGLEPSSGQYRVFLAQVQIKQNAFELARMTLLEALRIDSSQHEAYACLSDLYARRNMLDLALLQNQKAIEHVPITEQHKQIGYLRRKAALLRRMNRPEESLQTLRGLFPKYRDQIPVIEEMAMSWHLLGQPENGARLYEQQLILNPTQWQLAAGAATWWLKAGEMKNAERHVATVKRIDPWAPVIPELEKKLRRLKGQVVSDK